jgi:chromosome partitioning protein
MVNRSRRQVLPFSVVPTMYDRRTQASTGTLRLLQDRYADALWPGHIPVDTRLRDASLAGKTPSQFDSKSRGVLAYRALLKHLLTLQLEPQVA